jgi:aquaporin Z
LQAALELRRQRLQFECWSEIAQLPSQRYKNAASNNIVLEIRLISPVIVTRPTAKSHEGEFFDPAREWRRIFAEIWGTFLLVLVAAGGDIASAEGNGELTHTMAAIAPGLLVLAAIYFMGAVSGAHLNPAVTFAFALRRNFPWRRVPGYVSAQLIGAVAAAAFLRGLFGTVGEIGATTPHHGLTSLQALLIETVLTAGLVNTVLGTASGARNIGTNAGIAVGSYIALSGIWASSFTGASMNPARSLGPDLLRGDLSTTWIYIAGPLLGAILGVMFEWILKGPPTKSGARAAQGEDEH